MLIVLIYVIVYVIDMMMIYREELKIRDFLLWSLRSKRNYGIRIEKRVRNRIEVKNSNKNNI